ncbi:hypothetical protein MKW94_027092 [Papaver nudicaule]|uniref:TF-B3 domain-containing protein n=1 Tax=Papaver nudicaule TaxID=74823 RepID=A0AA41V323_PAPNU|nr:hypothetical protein [Papaver nudicaule]
MIEMKRFVGPDRKYRFFKVLLEEDEFRMRIPEAFLSRISRKSQSREQAVIKGPSGAHWVTEVNKSRDGIFLEIGWEVFVRENGLRMYDFLVFKYHGNMRFSVKVFNMYGVPREECFTPVHSSPSSGCPPVGRPLRSRERRFVEVEQQRRRQDGNESDEDDNEDEVPRKTLKLSSSRKKRRQSIDAREYARANEIEHRFASRSSFPFFRVILQPAYLRCNYLPIPVAARRAYFPDDLKTVKVKYSDGRSWKLGILHSKRGIRLSSGASKFIKKKTGLNLKLGDVCVFEIVEKRSHQLVLQVNVSRRVPILDDDSDDDLDEDLEDNSDE